MLTEMISSHCQFEVVGAEADLRRGAARLEAVTTEQHVKFLATCVELVHKLAN